MSNIVWKTPENKVRVTEVADSLDLHDFAENLKIKGAIPPEWEVVGVDINLPQNFAGNEYLYVNGEITQDLDGIKIAVWSKIKAERDSRKAGGVKVGAKWFHSDDASRIQQMGLVMMGASIPANLQWKTMDGSFIAMTQTLASQVFQTVAAGDQAIFAVAEGHRVAMEASADPASYDYSGGWPKIYGE